MTRPRFEVADVFRRYGHAFRARFASSLSCDQLRVMHAIESCRTAALGGHLEQCDRCAHQRPAYNSCLDRHCPKCQSCAKAKWLEARQRDLLPIEYFHVVFTIPDCLASVALQNKRTLYNILFQATAQTLSTIAADPKHLGAKIGFLAVLHTWGQNVLHHPHLHCVIPGGGFHPNEPRWISCRPGFFLPVRVLSRLFRRLFLEKLSKAFQQGELQFHGSLTPLGNPFAFKRLLRKAKRTEWVVYAKPPFGGPQHVLDYLARYTHRVAISNDRLLNVEDGKVTFEWKDYRRGNQKRTMTLDAAEFTRRFLLHTLPRGFVRIRHYGFLANRNRTKNIELARTLLCANGDTDQPLPDRAALPQPPGADDLSLCPKCKLGRMIPIDTLPAHPHVLSATPGIDSS